MANVPAGLRCTSLQLLDPACHSNEQVDLVIPKWYRSTTTTTDTGEKGSTVPPLGVCTAAVYAACAVMYSSMLITDASSRQICETSFFLSTSTMKFLTGSHPVDYVTDGLC